MSKLHGGYVNSRVLKFQIGFLLSEGRGHSSDMELDVPRLRVAEDLDLDYLKGNLRFSRTSEGILVQGLLHTSYHGECNRCLEDVLVPIDVPLEELFIYPPRPGADYTVSDDGILDLAPLLREEIILDTPMGVLCKPDCAGLCLECGHNLNNGPCNCEKQNIDPRLAALKMLKDQLSDK